jgi:hypothetical protein
VTLFGSSYKIQIKLKHATSHKPTYEQHHTKSIFEMLKRMKFTIRRESHGGNNQQKIERMCPRHIKSSTARNNNYSILYSSSFLLTSSCFTSNPICISSSRIISHSLRSIPVDGEYCVSTNKRLIHGEMAPKASAKIHVALFFMDPRHNRTAEKTKNPKLIDLHASYPRPALSTLEGRHQNAKVDPSASPTS